MQHTEPYPLNSFLLSPLVRNTIHLCQTYHSDKLNHTITRKGQPMLQRPGYRTEVLTRPTTFHHKLQSTSLRTILPRSRLAGRLRIHQHYPLGFSTPQKTRRRGIKLHSELTRQ
jgi:hypothetical protein